MTGDKVKRFTSLIEPLPTNYLSCLRSLNYFLTFHCFFGKALSWDNNCVLTVVKNLQLQNPCVPVGVGLFICSLGSGKKCLSSTVSSAVTMATPTGFSSCAVLKNVRLSLQWGQPAHNAAVQPRLCSDTACCWFNSFGSPALRTTAWLILKYWAFESFPGDKVLS